MGDIFLLEKVVLVPQVWENECCRLRNGIAFHIYLVLFNQITFFVIIMVLLSFQWIFIEFQSFSQYCVKDFIKYFFHEITRFHQHVKGYKRIPFALRSFEKPFDGMYQASYVENDELYVT